MTAPPTPGGAPFPPALRRLRVPLALAVLALMLLGAAAAFAWRSGRVRAVVGRLQQRLAGEARAQPAPSAQPAAGASRAEQPLQLAASVYRSGLQPGWVDFGWATRKLEAGAPASLDLAGFGGWIVARPGLVGRYGALVFRLKPPPGEKDFLEVRVDSGDGGGPPAVPVLAAHRRDLGEGWQEVVVPMSELNPGRQQFDRLIFRAFRQVANGKVLLDQIGFTAVDEAKEAAERAAILGRARPAPMAVDCRARATRISPFIYGTAGHGNPAPAQQWKLDFAARRWGGNPTSTYNWQLHAWNTGSDWFFENVGVPPYTSFLDQNRQHRTESFLTVPIMGWVAKDDASSSFRRDLVPGQARFDQWRPKAGDGRTADGKPLPAGPPTRTFVPAPPDFIAGWVKAIRARDAATGTRSVREYILDNEPMLWSSTHRGAHPEPVTYDELLDRTIRYATAIREVDPEALIAGPALWGWPAYHYSGLDAADNFRSKPDYRAHGSTFLLPWWLKRLQAHEQKTGKKLVDVVDVHFYPQAQGVYSEGGDAVAALRIRSTRALWDPTYDDESWIADRIELIPLLKRWIAENNPGLKIQIGEWSFGGEKHPSGGLATAEALGRFGALGVFAAFYWTLPPDGSPAFQAFRAYLDFDGAGGRFLDHSLPASAAPGTSLFASRDAEGKRAVLVVLNFSPTEAIAPALDLAGCGPVTGRRTFIYEPGGPGFALTDRPGGEVPPLPPSSISVVELHFGQVMPGALD